MVARGFGFGIEAEFLLVKKADFSPLWIDDLKTSDLLALVDSIYTQDIPFKGLNHKPLHNLVGHYLIEGYTLTDGAMQPKSLLPKGIEIRTPTTGTVQESVAHLELLHDRLNQKLAEVGLSIAIVSHHPTRCEFDAPQNYSRHDYWQWARTATATYGPDFNISLPQLIGSKIDHQRLALRANYYLPAVVALSFASPIFEGKLWTDVNGVVGKSVRTFRRSLHAPSHYIHEEPSLRFEFKGFEMSRALSDYYANFLLSLAILLDESLEGIATGEERITDLRNLAVTGLASQCTRDRAWQVIESASRTATRYGICSKEHADSVLAPLRHRATTGKLPADDIIADYIKHDSDISSVLRGLHGLAPIQALLTTVKSAPVPAQTTVQPMILSHV